MKLQIGRSRAFTVSVVSWCSLFLCLLCFSAPNSNAFQSIATPRRSTVITATAKGFHDDDEIFDQSPVEVSNQQRRSLIQSVFSASLAVIMAARPVLAASAMETVAESPPVAAPTALSPKVTDRVIFNIRISRSDGTFYVRDYAPPPSTSAGAAAGASPVVEQSTEEMMDEPFYAKLTLELFGEDAPQTVAKFKSYLPDKDSSRSMLDDNPPPTFARSSFPAVDPTNGLIMAGRIPGLELTTVGTSGSALQYGGRLLPAPLWLEPKNDNSNRQVLLSHTTPGLLTHKVLEPLPLFGITTAASSPEMLDGTHVVFGRLVLDNDGSEFMDRVTQIPTYQTNTVPTSDDATVRTAQAVFRAQQGFFQQTAKALGDTRIDKVYNGKLLRRVEVTQVQVL